MSKSFDKRTARNLRATYAIKLVIKKQTIILIYIVSVYTPFNDLYKDNIDNLIEDMTANKRA